GHSGAGTYAGAMVAIDAAAAPRLYPPDRGTPHFRVVQGTYTSCPAVPRRDNREVTGAVLIEEPQAGSSPLPPAVGGRPKMPEPHTPRGAPGSTTRQASKRVRPKDGSSVQVAADGRRGR